MSKSEQLYPKFHHLMQDNFQFVALDEEISTWIVSTMEKGILAKEGVVKGMTVKLTGSFAKWREFLAEARVDIFLQDCDLHTEQVFSGFVHQLRNNYTGKTSQV